MPMSPTAWTGRTGAGLKSDFHGRCADYTGGVRIQGWWRTAAFSFCLMCLSMEPAVSQMRGGAVSPPSQSPFRTPLPWILAAADREITVEGDWVSHERVPFSIAGTSIDRSRASLFIDASHGLGSRVEGSLRLGVQDSVGDDAGGITATDLDLAIGYSLRGEPGRSLSAFLTTKVPTAPEHHGAGTDETDVGFLLSAGSRGPRGGSFIAAGLALLGNPLRNGAQDDVARFGAGLWRDFTRGWSGTGEIEGRAFSRFNNDATALHLGLRKRFAARSGHHLSWHVAFVRGLNAESSRYGLSAGTTVASF